MIETLDTTAVEELLREQVVGRIGMHASGRTYVVPITYVYDGAAVYAHSSDGKKLEMMRANPHVCFEVDDVRDLGDWRSVIAWGKFEELHGDDAARALGLLVSGVQDLHPRGKAPDGPGGENGASFWDVVVYRIRLTEKHGRVEQAIRH
jgi:nitroimidazol reductase NimA-like FMN-containing flavoprotein (pyridoxamine 5'-phosphate oxidase superfamily)